MSGRPPFRADVVGSLLRPPELRQARASAAGKEQGAAELSAVEDRLIAEAVRKQERIGLKAVSDGEFRRSWWHLDFFAGLEGTELVAGEGRQFHGIQTRSDSIVINGKVGWADHAMVGHFRYLARVAKVLPKMAIPAPSVLHFRRGRNGISRHIYPDLDEFFSDTARAYRQAVGAFYQAGCRYLQFDDTSWGYLCSQTEREAVRARGDDPEALPAIYARLVNEALRDKPDDMVVTTHVCRGNYRSSWFSEGGYESVAETMLAGTAYDGFFLEFDTGRAGGFEPLRFLPKGSQRVVLGLVTSKTGELEPAGELERRIDQAAAHADLDQLCLSPQCGFASTEEGNLLTPDEQWKKLERVVEVATKVWGGV